MSLTGLYQIYTLLCLKTSIGEHLCSVAVVMHTCDCSLDTQSALMSIRAVRKWTFAAAFELAAVTLVKLK